MLSVGLQRPSQAALQTVSAFPCASARRVELSHTGIAAYWALKLSLTNG